VSQNIVSIQTGALHMLDINQFQAAIEGLQDDILKARRALDVAALVHLSNATADSAQRVSKLQSELASLEGNLALLQGASRQAESQAISQDIEAKRQAAQVALDTSAAAMARRQAIAKKLDATMATMLSLVAEYREASSEASSSISSAIMAVTPINEDAVNKIALLTGPAQVNVIAAPLGQFATQLREACSGHSWFVRLTFSTAPDRTCFIATDEASRRLESYVKGLVPVHATEATEAPTQAAEAIADEVAS
jgi:chromosome segregation ATPase